MHTRAPWRKDTESGNIYGDGKTVAYDIARDEDADLIAAAPELLKALETLLEYDPCRCGYTGCKYCKAEENALAALHKAKGGSTISGEQTSGDIGRGSRSKHIYSVKPPEKGKA